MTDRGGDYGSEEEGRKGQEAGSEEEGREGQVEEVVLPTAVPGVDPMQTVGAGTSAFSPGRVQFSPIALKTALSNLLASPVADELFGSGIRPVYRVVPSAVRSITLPEGTEITDVRPVYKDADENMRIVREVNEDPADEILLTVTKRVPVVIDRIVLSVNLETK